MAGIVIIILMMALVTICVKYYLDSRKWKMQKADLDRQYKELLDQKENIDVEMKKQVEKQTEKEKQLEQRLAIFLDKISHLEEKIAELENDRNILYDSARNIHLYGQLLKEESETAPQMEASDTILKECGNIMEICKGYK